MLSKPTSTPLSSYMLIARVKRAKEKKTKRAKTIKQLNSMGRRHLLGVRVVMKNMVYVVGMKIPGSGDEVS
jgi:CCR4-NOT transcription complex subunit 4